jgi:adenylate cyclase
MSSGSATHIPIASAPRRTGILLGICGAATSIILGMYLVGFTPLLEAELYAQDLRARLGRKTPVHPQFVFIGITKPAYRDVPLEQDTEALGSPTLQKLRGNFPWTRDVWADLIERLAGAGAKVVALDLMFAAPGTGDDQLAAALERHRDKVVVASNFSDTRQVGGGGLSLTLPSPSLIPPGTNNSAAFDSRVGFVNFWPDWDSLVRRARFKISDASLVGLAPSPSNPQFHESFAARVLRHMGQAEAIPSGEAPRLFRFTGEPGDEYRAIPLNDVFSPKLWEQTFHRGEFFQGKVVVIGPAANFLHDEHLTAISHGVMLGPELHLNVIAAALNNEFLTETTLFEDVLIILLAGVVAAFLCVDFKRGLLRLGMLALASGAYLLICFVMFNSPGVILPAMPPFLVLNLSVLGTLAFDFVRERNERNRIRRTLERYVSKNIVHELLDNPDTFLHSLGGERRPVTVLFSDVRNFTSMTEGCDEVRLVHQLNEYFTEMVGLVFARHGTLDKFIGDAVMAVWGNIVTDGPEEDARHAVATALAMKASLIRLNQRWRERGWPELSFGIGINQGEAIVGNLGSTEKMELTVIGDAVNLASRLEGQTKEYRLELLLGENAAALVRSHFILRTVDLIQVKGKTRPVDTFTTLGEYHGPESLPSWLAAYENGVLLYRRRSFSEAAQAFEATLQQMPDDFLASLYLKRCHQFLASPPGDDWNGVYIAKSK